MSTDTNTEHEWVIAVVYSVNSEQIEELRTTDMVSVNLGEENRTMLSHPYCAVCGAAPDTQEACSGSHNVLDSGLDSPTFVEFSDN
jgi:hypothetical protein